jgi:HAD superfamily hydrolase (TIGR01509 family)
MAAMAEKIEALLFDLGGVIIDIDFGRVCARWAEHAGCDAAALRARLIFDEPAHHHEIGKLDDAQFFGHLRQMLGLQLSDEQLLDGWNAIFVGEMPGIAALLEEAKARLPLYAFSNTNRAHELCWSARFKGVLTHFRHVFVSSTIGLRKPDAAAFDHVVKAMGVPASRVLFFDDTLANVEGARAAGLQAAHVRRTEEIAAALAPLLTPAARGRSRA